MYFFLGSFTLWARRIMIHCFCTLIAKTITAPTTLSSDFISPQDTTTVVAFFNIKHTRIFQRWQTTIVQNVDARHSTRKRKFRIAGFVIFHIWQPYSRPTFPIIKSSSFANISVSRGFDTAGWSVFDGRSFPMRSITHWKRWQRENSSNCETKETVLLPSDDRFGRNGTAKDRQTMVDLTQTRSHNCLMTHYPEKIFLMGLMREYAILC